MGTGRKGRGWKIFYSTLYLGSVTTQSTLLLLDLKYDLDDDDDDDEDDDGDDNDDDNDNENYARHTNFHL